VKDYDYGSLPTLPVQAKVCVETNRPSMLNRFDGTVADPMNGKRLFPELLCRNRYKLHVTQWARSRLGQLNLWMHRTSPNFLKCRFCFGQFDLLLSIDELIPH
jgi:hypothetical protein